MKPHSDLIDRVRTELGRSPAVTEKRMFGSTGFLIRGKLAVGARPERIMCRVNPDLTAELLKRPGCRAVVMRGRTLKGYVHVDASVLSTGKALNYWIDLVLQQNQALTRSKKTATRATAKRTTAKRAKRSSSRQTSVARRTR